MIVNHCRVCIYTKFTIISKDESNKQFICKIMCTYYIVKQYKENFKGNIIITAVGAKIAYNFFFLKPQNHFKNTRYIFYILNTTHISIYARVYELKDNKYPCRP